MRPATSQDIEENVAETLAFSLALELRVTEPPNGTAAKVNLLNNSPCLAASQRSVTKIEKLIAHRTHLSTSLVHLYTGRR